MEISPDSGKAIFFWLKCVVTRACAHTHTHTPLLQESGKSEGLKEDKKNQRFSFYSNYLWPRAKTEAPGETPSVHPVPFVTSQWADPPDPPSKVWRG